MNHNYYFKMVDGKRKYDYESAVNGQVWEWYEENEDVVKDCYDFSDGDCWDFAELIYDKIIRDDIFGIDFSSYTITEYEAEEFLLYNYDWLKLACNSFCISINQDDLCDNPEYVDAIIREYFLNSAVHVLADSIFSLYEEAEEEE